MMYMGFRDWRLSEGRAYDGEVHDLVMISSAPRTGFGRVVNVNEKPAEVPDGMRIVRTFRLTGDVMEREYALERTDA